MNKDVMEYTTIVDGGHVELALQEAITIGGVSFVKACLRQLKAGDILDAQEDAERLVHIKGGDVALVMSPARMARETLRRQVVRLESADGMRHDGPLSVEELGLFSSLDMLQLQSAASVLDFSSSLAAEGVQSRGRSAPSGEKSAPTAGIDAP